MCHFILDSLITNEKSTVNGIFPLSARCFSLLPIVVFCFFKSEYHVPWCGFVEVYPDWSLLSFLESVDLWLLSDLGKVQLLLLLILFQRHTLSALPLWLRCLLQLLSSLRLCSSFGLYSLLFRLGSLFSSVLISRSLVLSSVFSILLLSPSLRIYNFIFWF